MPTPSPTARWDSFCVEQTLAALVFLFKDDGVVLIAKYAGDLA
jgi:hypothetical protein